MSLKTALKTSDTYPAPEAGEILSARTYDIDTVMTFYSEPRIWEPMQCDGAPKSDQVNFEALLSEDFGDHCIFVTSTYEREVAGLFMFNSTTTHCYDIHSALAVKFWGKGISHMLGQAACFWMFENTVCRKITTSVPSFNHHARNMAMAAGMRVEGCNRSSFMKSGKMYDQLLLGFTKEELLCQ